MKEENNKYQVATTWNDSYSDSDKKDIEYIITWLNEPTNQNRGWSFSLLGRRASIVASTFNLVINGKYSTKPTKQIKKALDVVKLEMDRQKDGVGIGLYVETSVYKMTYASCKRANVYRMFSVLSANVGTGKTTALKHYCKLNPNAILIEATPDLNASVLMDEIIDQTGAIVNKANRFINASKAEKLRAVISTLAGTDRLIILDEAETVTPQTLEYLRRISDKAEIGVVLAGTSNLRPMIRNKRGRFGQISSRVNYWPPVIESISSDDSIALVNSLLPDEDIDDATYKAFNVMSDGSARVLCNSLIPGVKDYGLKKGAKLTAALVMQVSQKILGFEPRRGVS